MIYAIGRSATVTLLVLNSRPVSRLNRERSQEARELARALRDQAAERRRGRDVP